uniref:Uncharacterized protein n=1 Tax=Pinctada fucata TaxID=50426 RepID=A0A194ANK2_PINFU
MAASDISEVVDLSGLSDDEINEVHYDSRCYFEIKEAKRRINHIRYTYYIHYRVCFCGTYENPPEEIRWSDLKLGREDGVVVHGLEDCCISSVPYRTRSNKREWSLEEICSCNTRN